MSATSCQYHQHLILTVRLCCQTDVIKISYKTPKFMLSISKLVIHKKDKNVTEQPYMYLYS